MTPSSRTLARTLWIGLVLLVAGRVLDLQWHASHDEFETASDQLRAHWLAWVGALVLLVGAGIAVRERHRSPMPAVLLIGAVGYAAVAVWHFYEHSQLRDPDLPHVLLAISQILMFVGAPLAARALSQQPTRIDHA
jgi:cytochrome bd-type quinol oxidase subunit 2